MSVDTKKGYARSSRSKEEEETLLEEMIEKMSPEELEALKIVLDGVSSPYQTSGKKLLSTISELEYVRTPVGMEEFVRNEYYLGNTCDTLYPRLLDDLVELFDGGYNEAIFTGSIGYGKCVSSLAPVFDCISGERKPIKAFEGREDVFAPSLHEDGSVLPAHASKIWKSGRKQCAKLTLASGQYLEASLDHPVLTDRGYVALGELKPGDFVAAARSVPGPQVALNISDAEVVAVGGLLAGGSLTGYRTHVCYSKNPLTTEKFLSVVSKLDQYTGHKVLEQTEKCQTTSIRGLGDFCDRWGINGVLSKHKRIPPKMFGLSDSQTALLLRWIWTDGHVAADSSVLRLELTLASEGLIDDVQYLLRRFGVVGRKYVHNKRNQSGKTFDAWTLILAESPQILKFLYVIGDIPGYEDRCATARVRAEEKLGRSNTNYDVVPVGIEELKTIRRETGPHEDKWWAKNAGLSKGSHMGREKFLRLCNAIGYRGNYWKLASADVVWEKVKTIEARGMQDVYDLTVHGTHNAEVGGIIVHNTFTASIGVCRCLYELSCMRDPQRSFGIASNSNISIVCLSVNEDLAMKVAYENIAGKIEASPYFKEHFPFQKTKKELRFPSKIIVAARATTDNSVLGLNVIGGLLDECLMGCAKVFLWDGSQEPIETLVGRDDVVVETFDFEAGKAIPALAQVKRSTDQECYELVLANGMVLCGSEDHPIAIRTVDGRLVYHLIGDVVEGQDVVVYGEVDRREEGRSQQENEGALGEREVYGTEAECGGGREAEGGCQTHARGRSGSCTSNPVGRIESVLREESYARAKEAFKRVEDREETLRRRQEAYVREKEGESYPLIGIQEGFVRTESCAERRFQAHRRSETKDFKEQCVEAQERVFQVRGVGGNRESGSRWISKPVRIARRRAVGTGFVSDTLRVREVGSTLLVEREHPPHITGFPYMGVRGPGYRGEATRLHLPFQREGQDSGRSDFLRGARLGLRGLGRVLSVAKVVSKRKLGVQPTYDLSVPGYEAYVADGFLVHNSNFMRKRKSNDPRFNLEDHAQVLYNAMMRRMKSRFGRRGKLPGTLFVVSSKQSHDDFTAKRIRESKNDPSVFVRDYALWDVKPEIYYSGDWFHVVVGNEQSPSRILDIDEDPVEIEKNLSEGCVLIPVPEDHKADFERDLEGSIRDLAGCATVSVSPFIQRREKIIEAVDPKRKHPFSSEVYDPTHGGSFKWGQMVQKVSEVDLGADRLTSSYKPIVNPHAPRHIHIDPSLSGDATGFCMGHIAGYKSVVRRDDEGFNHQERAPIIYVDLVLRIVPPVGDEIMIGDVRRFVYQLSRHGYMITMVTMDSWQSAEGIQKLHAKGYNAEILSVDKTVEPYACLKSALYENRVHLYEYPTLLKELRELEHDRIKRKIDHPNRGSKDVSDALAGVCHTLTEKSTHLPIGMLTSRSGDPDAWMQEHMQKSLAESYGASDDSDGIEGGLEDTSYGNLPPFIVGDFGGSGWGS